MQQTAGQVSLFVPVIFYFNKFKIQIKVPLNANLNS